MEIHPKYFPPEGGMNSDMDQRTVPETDVRKVLNGRWGKTRNGSIGAIEKIQGNELVGEITETGISEVIGSVSDIDQPYVYFFVYNSDEKHSIQRYDGSTNTLTVIVKDPFLNFSLDHKIYNPKILVNADEGFLYWTDGLNPPRVLDIGKARRGEIALYDDNLLDVIKHPPPFIYDAFYESEVDIDSNMLDEQQFQFSIRFIYQSFAKSRWSSWSKVPILQGTMYSNGYRIQEKTANNIIAIKFRYKFESVQEIEIGVRDSLTKLWGSYETFPKPELLNFIGTSEFGSYYIWNIPDLTGLREGLILNDYLELGTDTFIVEIDIASDRIKVSNRVLTTVTDYTFSIDQVHMAYPFKNEKLQNILDQNDFRTLFDAVPQLAGSQEIVEGDRMVYGDITEGYDNLSPLEMRMNLRPKWIQVEALNPQYGSGTTTYGGGGQNRWMRVDFIDATDIVAAIFELGFRVDKATNPRNVFLAVKTDAEDLSEVMSQLAAEIAGANIANITGATSGPDWVEVQSNKTLLNGYGLWEGVAFVAPSLKFGTSQLFGVVYYDRANRSGAVNTYDQLHVHVPWYNIFNEKLKILYEGIGNTLGDVATIIGAGDLSGYAGKLLTVISGANAGFRDVITSGGVDTLTVATLFPDITQQTDVQMKVGESYFRKDLTMQMDWSIFHTPPIWATHYQIVWGLNSDQSNFMQFLLPYDPALVPPFYYQKVDTNYWAIELNRILAANKAVYPNKEIEFYTYTKGDRLRIIGYKDPEAGPTLAHVIYLSNNIDIAIVGEDWNADSESYEQDEADGDTGADKEFIRDANGNKIRNNEFSHILIDRDIAAELPTGGTLPTYAVLLVEIYSPRKLDKENILYYECGENFAIGNPGTPERYHKGKNEIVLEASTFTVVDIQRYIGVMKISQINYDPSFSTYGDGSIQVGYVDFPLEDFEYFVNYDDRLEDIYKGISEIMETKKAVTAISGNWSLLRLAMLPSSQGANPRTMTFVFTGGATGSWEQMILRNDSEIYLESDFTPLVNDPRYIGMRVEFRGAFPGESMTIVDTHPDFLYTERFSAASSGTYLTFDVISRPDQEPDRPDIPATGTTNISEVYVRYEREQYDDTSQTWNEAILENKNVTDFFKSDLIDKGRVNIINPDAIKLDRVSTLRHGKKYFQENKVNEIGKFDFDDQITLDLEYGKVRGMRFVGYILKVLQDFKLTSVYISRSVAYTPDGTESQLISDKVFANVKPYEEVVGTRFPGSIYMKDRHLYFMDAEEGKFFRDAPNGLHPISDYMMSTFFRQQSDLWKNTTAKVNILVNYDERYDELLVSLISDGTDSNLEDFTIAFAEGINRWKSYYSFIPTWYGKLGDLVISWDGYTLYIHDSLLDAGKPLYNQFYGVNYPSEVEFIFNKDALTSKVFHGIAVHSNRIWSPDQIGDLLVPADDLNPDGMESKIPLERFKYVEGAYYSDILRNQNTPGKTGDDSLVNGEVLRGRVLQVIVRNEDVTDVDLRNLILYFNKSLPL